MFEKSSEYYTVIYIEKEDLEKFRVYELLNILHSLRADIDRDICYSDNYLDKKENYHKKNETEWRTFEWDYGWRKVAKICEVKEVLSTRKHILSKKERSLFYTPKQKRVLKYRMK